MLKGETDLQGRIVYVADHAAGYYHVGETTRSSVHSVGALMEKGNRVLLFLKVCQNPVVTEDGVVITHYLTLGYEGKYFYDRDGKYHNTVKYATNRSVSQLQ